MGTFGVRAHGQSKGRAVTNLEVAWAAGIFEGEGSCNPVPPRGKYTVPRQMVGVSQKDPWLLERLKDMFGGHIYLKSDRRNPSPLYRWQIDGPRGRGFLLTIYPFLSPRRKEQIMRTLKPGVV
jgi:hypothetical protein